MKRKHGMVKKISAFLLAGVLAAAFPATAAAQNDNVSDCGDFYNTEAEEGVSDSSSKTDGEKISDSAAGYGTSEPSGGVKTESTKKEGNAETGNIEAGNAETENNGDKNTTAENSGGENTGAGNIEKENGGGEDTGTGNIEAENSGDEDAGAGTETETGTESSGTQDFTSADPATGIRAEAKAGVIPSGAAMIVTPVESGGNYELLKMLLEVSLEKFKIYDISFFDLTEQTLIQPDGKVKITIPVPEDFEKDRIGVYHINTDGQKTEIAFTIENGCAVFETDHFSLYAVGEKKEETGAELPPSLSPTEKVERIELKKTYPEETAQMKYVSAAKVPKTGDESEFNGWIILTAAAVVVIGGCVAVIIRNRKK